MFKHFFFLSIFLFFPFIGKNQPSIFCHEGFYLSTISSIGINCPIFLDVALSYNYDHCHWSTVYQFLHLGNCSAILRIPAQHLDVYATTVQCTNHSQYVRLDGSVYYQWEMVQSVAGIDVVIDSGTYIREMSDKLMLC